MPSSARHISFPKVFFRSFGYTMLLLTAYPGIAASSGARQAMLWNRLDTVALLVDLMAIPFVLAIVLWSLNKLFRGKLFRLGKPLLPFLYAIALMQLLPQHILHAAHVDHYGVWVPYLCIAALGALLSVLACRKHWTSLLDSMATILPMFTIMFPLYACQFLLFPSFSGSNTFNTIAIPTSVSSHPNVLIFSFDSISLDDCICQDGSWRKDLPASYAFQGKSIRFDAAVSGGTHTMASVPRFLFQSISDIQLPNESAPAIDGGKENGTLVLDSPLTCTNGLFYLAKSAGYHTAAVTSYVPLGQLAAAQLDEALDLPFTRYLPPTSFLMRCLDHLVAFVDLFRPRLDAFARLTGGHFPWPPHQLANHYFVGLVRSQLDAVHAHVDRLPPSGEFFYAHLVGVHRPYLFLEDGSVDEKHATPNTQLCFTDSVFGALMDDLSNHDRFDSAWIIFTSDHGRQTATATEEELRHVPFIVKPPRGIRPLVCDTTVSLWNIAPFFQAIFHGLSPEQCLALLASEQFGE